MDQKPERGNCEPAAVAVAGMAVEGYYCHTAHSQRIAVMVVEQSTCYAVNRAEADIVCYYGTQRHWHTEYDHSEVERYTWESSAVDMEAAASYCRGHSEAEVDEMEAAHIGRDS